MGLGRIFRNPWWLVFGSTLALIVGNGPVMVFTFGVFLKPVISEFGWNRGTVSAALTAYQTIGAIATPLAGKLVDRWGVRRVTLVSIAVFSLSIAVISRTPSSPPIFLLLYGMCGLLGSGHAPLPYAKAISARFETHRGLALGIAMGGVGVGTALMPQLGRALVQSFGWRDAYVGLGILTFVVAFPSAFLFVREPNYALLDRGKRVKVSGMTLDEALKGSPRFWFLISAVFLVSAVTNGVTTHIVPLLTDRGLSTEVATLALTSIGLAMIAGRVFGGYLIDRFFAPYVAAYFFMMPLVGIILLGTGSAGVVLPLGTICIGLGLGSEIALMGFFVGRYFGLRVYGEIYGYVMSAFLVGAGLGAWVMGACFDATHSYHLAFVGFSLSLIVASFLICQLGPYVYPVSRSLSRDTGPSGASSA